MESTAIDNVGGAVTDAIFPVLNTKARISISGQISQYNLQKPEPRPAIFSYLLTKAARAEGFLVYQFVERFPEGIAGMSQWIKEGKLK
jgi:NADPH-dependent curcumin reductase CurA